MTNYSQDFVLVPGLGDHCQVLRVNGQALRVNLVVMMGVHFSFVALWECI
jgi:hypothetical protein